jgi:hypothetical protein
MLVKHSPMAGPRWRETAAVALGVFIRPQFCHRISARTGKPCQQNWSRKEDSSRVSGNQSRLVPNAKISIIQIIIAFKPAFHFCWYCLNALEMLAVLDAHMIESPEAGMQ